MRPFEQRNLRILEHGDHYQEDRIDPHLGNRQPPLRQQHIAEQSKKRNGEALQETIKSGPEPVRRERNIFQIGAL
jgi:hypothetical protein